MTPNQYINKAIHAINTDQPNLAMLYMRRGMEVLEERRRARLLEQPFGAFVLLGEEFEKLGQAIVDSVVPAFKVFADVMEGFQRQVDRDFFALVGDN